MNIEKTRYRIFYANRVTVLGKGSKERFVPFGASYFRQSIENYLEHFKPIQSCNHDFLL